MGCFLLRFWSVKGIFFSFRVDFNSILQFFVFCTEERNEVTCCGCCLLGDCILVLGGRYMLLIWFFLKAKWLGNEKEILHKKN